MLLDSDFGNDVDDVFALQMLINYEKQGAVDLLGIGVVKSTPMALDFARSYYGKFGCGDPDFGMVSDGPNPDDGAYMRRHSMPLSTASPQVRHPKHGR